jgi:hypothetical protein
VLGEHVGILFCCVEDQIHDHGPEPAGWLAGFRPFLACCGDGL